MADEVVIGIDSSTTGTKAVAFDRTGRALCEGRAPIPMQNPKLGHFEQKPADWWDSTAAALRDCVAALDGAPIAGVTISNQRETVGFFGEDGGSVRPAMLWLDDRCGAEVEEFRKSFGAERIHKMTGRPPDMTTAIYKMIWLQKHEPEVAERVATYADVQSYLVHRLAGGPLRTGWPSADPLGVFDVTQKRWSAELLSAIGLTEDRLPKAHPPGTELGEVGAGAAECGLPEGTKIYAGGGDGQLAGLGTNCTGPERAYINLGTAVVSGVWTPQFLYDRAWRTLIAGQGEGYICENCLRSGTFILNWFVDRFVPGGRDDPKVYQRLEAEAANIPIGSEGVMVQPYWSAVMDPHWDVDARGVIFGLSASHTAAHVYRAILEGIVLDQVVRTKALEAAMGTTVDHFVAIGGGAASSLWTQMLADAAQKPVHLSDTVEASALGAAMLAAAGAGWYETIEAAASAMAGATRPVEPNLRTAERYQRLGAIYADVYAATAATNRALVAFAAEAA